MLCLSSAVVRVVSVFIGRLQRSVYCNGGFSALAIVCVIYYRVAAFYLYWQAARVQNVRSVCLAVGCALRYRVYAEIEGISAIGQLTSVCLRYRIYGVCTLCVLVLRRNFAKAVALRYNLSVFRHVVLSVEFGGCVKRIPADRFGDVAVFVVRSFRIIYAGGILFAYYFALGKYKQSACVVVIIYNCGMLFFPAVDCGCFFRRFAYKAFVLVIDVRFKGCYRTAVGSVDRALFA